MNDMVILKIKDRKYGMRKMPPLQGSSFGIKVASLLSKVLANPGAKDALESLKNKLGLDSVNNGVNDLSNDQALTAGAAIIGLLSTIPAGDITAIFSEAFSYEVYYENTRLSDVMNFDIHFQQYPQDLYIVAIWATYHNVKDFFSGIGDGMKALIPNSNAMKSPELAYPKSADLTGR